MMIFQSINRSLAALVLLLSMSHGQVSTAWEFLGRQLTPPSSTQQRMDRHGTDLISDGLQAETDEQAIGGPFEEGQQMAFVDERRSTDEGVETADDDCD